MIRSCTTFSCIYTFHIILKRLISCVNKYSNRSFSNRCFKCFLTTLKNKGAVFYLPYFLLGLVVWAILIFTFVFILSLCSYSMVNYIPHRPLNISSFATFIIKVPRAINYLLFRKWEESSCLLVICSLKGTSCSKCIACTTYSLIFYRCHCTMFNPINWLRNIFHRRLRSFTLFSERFIFFKSIKINSFILLKW